RQDNADLRLTPAAYERGIVEKFRGERTREKARQLQEAAELIANTRFGEITVEKWLRRPENTWPVLPEDMRAKFSAEIWELLETDTKYEGYIRRQQDEVARTEKQENRVIPDWVDYLAVRGLKKEAQMKLNQIRPRTLGQAGRIS